MIMRARYAVVVSVGRPRIAGPTEVAAPDRRLRFLGRGLVGGWVSRAAVFFEGPFSWAAVLAGGALLGLSALTDGRFLGLSALLEGPFLGLSVLLDGCFPGLPTALSNAVFLDGPMAPACGRLYFCIDFHCCAHIAGRSVVKEGRRWETREKTRDDAR